MASAKKILCLGEVSWDRLWVLDHLPEDGKSAHLISDSGAPGGCALNTACVLQGLGARVVLASNPVGKDAHGNSIREYLKNIGLETDLAQIEGLATPHCQCMVEKPTGDRRFVLDHRSIGALIENAVRDQLPNWIKRTQAGEFSHAFVQPYTEKISRAFLEGVQKVPDFWILAQDIDQDSEFIPLVDALQISLPEGGTWSPESIAEIARPYFRGRLKQLFITGGAKGVAIAEYGKTPKLYPAIHARKVLDTTGCGDAFRAGVMFALSQGWSMDQAIRAGQRAGAYKAELYGSHFVEKIPLE